MTYANHIAGLEAPDTAELAAEIRLLVGRLARRLRQEATAGLTPSQLSVLASVERLGPLQLGDLARVESVAPPTLSRSIARLEGQGFVRRHEDPVDGRAVLVQVTAGGRRALRELRRARTAFLAERLATLSEADTVIVVRAVELLDEILGPPERPTPAPPVAAPPGGVRRTAAGRRS